MTRLGVRTLQGMLWGYIGKFIEFGLAFIFSVIVARKIGPMLYGSYNLFVNIAASILIFVSLGHEAILNKYIPEFSALGQNGRIGALIRTVFITRFVLFMAAGALVWFFAPFLAIYFSDAFILTCAALLFLLIVGRGLQSIFLAFFNAFLELRAIAVVTGISSAVAIGIVLFAFFRYGPTLRGVLSAVVISVMLSVSIFFVLALPFFSRRDDGYFCSLRKFVPFGITVWQANMLTYAISASLNILLMGKLLKDPLEIGFYATAVLFTYVPGNLVSSWASIILPVVSEARAKYGIGGVAEACGNFGKVIFLMLIPALTFLGIYAKSLVMAIFGTAFIPSAFVIQLFVVFNFFCVCAMPHVSFSALYAIDQPRLVLVIRFIAGVVNIILVLLLVKMFKAAGVMVAGSIAITFQTFAEYVVLRRFVAIRYPAIFLAKVVLVSLMAAALVFPLYKQTLPMAFLVSAIYGLLLLIGFHFLKVLSVDDKQFLSSLHPLAAAIARHF